MLSVVIQAGGQSRRMGQDKGLIPFLDEALVARVLRRVAPIADEVLVTTNRPQDYAFLGVRLVPDVWPGRGALGGLYTALAAAQHPLVAVVACDMPFASAPVLDAARRRLLESQADAVIPRTAAGLEPFHAVYRRTSCLPRIEAALQAGQWRADAWLPGAVVNFLPPDEVARYDPSGLAFLNINTPEELQAALRLAAASRDTQRGESG